MDLYIDADSTLSDDPRSAISRLERLWALLGDLMLSSKREARALLVTRVSCIDSLTHGQKLDAFLPLISAPGGSGGDAVHDAVEALVRLVCERQAPRVAKYLTLYQPRVLRSFFLGSRFRASDWFSIGGSMSSMSGFKPGARALCRFALRERDRCWDKLVWTGKHNQAPAVVATKVHYFQELDVTASVDGILRDEQLFDRLLQSDEWLEAISDGTILDVDIDYFVEDLARQVMLESREIVRRMSSVSREGRGRKEGNRGQDDSLGDLIVSCLTEASDWTLVCQRLLRYLPDGQILTLLGQCTSPSQHRSPPSSLLFESRGLSMNDNLVLNLLCCNHRELNAMVSTSSSSVQDKINQAVESLHTRDVSSSHRRLLQLTRVARSERRPVRGTFLSPAVIFALEAWSMTYLMRDLSMDQLTRMATSFGLNVEESTSSGKVYDLLESDDEGKGKKKKKRRREAVDDPKPSKAELWRIDGLLLNKIDLIERIISATCKHWLHM